MKLKYLAFLPVLLVPLLLANYQGSPDIFALSTPMSRWREIGTLTAAQAYPAAANMDYTTVAALVDANTITLELTGNATGFMLSFQTDADADSTTVALLGFADQYSYNTAGALVVDDAVYLGQLVLTGGTQVGKHTNVYADTIVATDGCWDFEVRDSGNNRRAIAIGDTLGFKRIVAIATTLQADSTLYMEARIW